jgi:hypothetical protein
LLELSQSETPSVRGYAWLGLARIGVAAALPDAAVARAIAALEHDRNPWARGSAALLLGFGARPRAQRAQAVHVALLAALQVDVDEVAAAAAVALGKQNRVDSLEALCARVFEGGELSSRAAAWALQATALHAGAQRPTAALVIPPPSDKVALSDVIEQQIALSLMPDAELPVAVRRELSAALRVALAGALPAVRSALRVLVAGDQERVGWTRAWTDALVADAADALGTLAQHVDVQVRTPALALIARLPAQQSAPTYAAALGSAQLAVRRSALEALGKADSSSSTALASQLAPQLARLSRTDTHWSVRAQSVSALALAQDARASHALIEALLTDASAYVREAAARSLGRRAGPRSLEEAAALQKAAATDSELLVRSQAAAALRPLR